MTEDLPQLLHSTLDLGSCNGVARNNQLFLYHPQKLNIKPCRVLHVKLFGWGGFLKMLVKSKKNQQKYIATLRVQLDWHTTHFIMQSQNTLSCNIILWEKRLSLRKLNIFIVTQVIMLLTYLLTWMEIFTLNSSGIN